MDDWLWERNSAWASLYATPTPDRSANGYRLSARFGLTQATAGGQRAVRRVVVGDDHVYAVLAGPLRLGVGADARVHGNDEAAALLGELVHGAKAQPVPLAGPGRDVRLHARAQRRQRLAHERRRRNAIHVVVAADDDEFAPADGVAQAHNRLVHIGQQKRGGDFAGAEEIALRMVGRFHPPIVQHLRDQGMHARRTETLEHIIAYPWSHLPLLVRQCQRDSLPWCGIEDATDVAR